MRPMTQEEMERLIGLAEWASICVTEKDGSPYVIEATPFRLEGDICFMINPRGGVYKCVRTNPRVLVKFTLAEPGLGHWAGVSCRGRGAFDPDEGALRRGWSELERIMRADYSDVAARLNKPTRSPLFRVRVESCTGRCSAAKDEACTLLAAL